ncbi:MAG: S-methyl-5-thioribose-1-phosphate isomerase, partial [Rhodothermales bacterium]
MIPPLRWNDHDFRIDMIDQTRLPEEEVWLEIETPGQMAEAIRMLRVRGAPAIGIAAAYGVVLALREDGHEDSHQAVVDAVAMLARTRPTAVNLFFALDRM